MEKIRIGLIGAGETGTPLLEQLLAAPFVDMVAVSDLSEAQPGMRLARANGVRTTADFMDIAALGAAVDIIIDTSGAREVRDRLRQYFQRHGNHHTVLMHETIAVLMMSLSQGHLVRSKHGWIEYD